jgi:hypothetical protein
VSGGFNNGQKEIQKWYVVTEEELIFVADGSLKWGVKIHSSMEKAFTLHPYNFCFYTAQ